jgi:hypothetical protein
MRTEPIMTRATLAALAALASLALSAAPARAQHANHGHGQHSDVGGHHVTSLLGASLRTVNEMFSRSGDAVVFRSARIGCAVRGAEQAFRDSVAGQPQTPEQRRVFELLAVDAGTPAPDAVAAALAHGAAPDSPLGMAAKGLADALSGLMRDRGACSQERAEYPEAPQWQQAIDAFENYVRHAPDSAFSPPAAELLAIHQALESVIAGALRRPDAH